MKANEAMKILQISRSTLLRWRKDGILKANKLPSQASMIGTKILFMPLINKGEKTGSVSLCTSSTPKQKHDLENFRWKTQKFRDEAGMVSGVAPGAFRYCQRHILRKKEFFELLTWVIAGKVFDC
ncbi:helix-turn-helix domain-containing protein [Dubosiella newyorkensis]|uniref:helix-turn-helix domain-containing protein n=1 Tax=Dubosiella newyorkensis TaxID=1862672 RepID=UPI003F66385E